MGRKQRSKRRTALIKRLDVVAEEQKLSHEEIGASVGVDRVTVYRWRRTGRGPSNGLIRESLERFIENREKATAS